MEFDVSDLPKHPERLRVLIARQRLENAARSYHDALATRHAGTIAATVCELGSAAVAFGNASTGGYVDCKHDGCGVLGLNPDCREEPR